MERIVNDTTRIKRANRMNFDISSSLAIGVSGMGRRLSDDQYFLQKREQYFSRQYCIGTTSTLAICADRPGDELGQASQYTINNLCLGFRRVCRGSVLIS